jgi:hypothetical protein
VCHLPFLRIRSFLLLSTKHVALRTNYSTEIAYINTPYKHNQTKQTIEKCLFNNLDYSRYCVRIDMTKEIWIVRYGFESLFGKRLSD